MEKPRAWVAVMWVAMGLGGGAVLGGESAPVVRPGCGALRGSVNPLNASIKEFKGIPFARPPVGDLRWRGPQALEAWGEVRDATQFGHACPQPMDDRKLKDTREDCLYLNVYTSADLAMGEKRAVMVWIHGGGFVNGAGSEGGYTGLGLVPRGVVLVTINYRLGALGFLAHPALSRESPMHVSGNYGLLDQVAALRWVQENIAAFGGDPGNVTIFGESAGAFSVARLMVSPLAKGLFHKAIAQSGHAHLANTPLNVAEGFGKKFTTALGCDSAGDAAGQMRGRSVEQVLAAQRKVSQEGDLFHTDSRFMPCVDGYVLPDSAPKILARGKGHDVPLMIGTTADEGPAFFLLDNPTSKETYDRLFREWFGEGTGVALGVYPWPADGSGAAGAKKQIGRMGTVALFAAGARWMAQKSSEAGRATYLYQFSRVPDTASGRRLGAHHALDVLYVFGLTRVVPGMNQDDHKLAEAMQEYWTNFAKTGDPNGKGLVEWPRYDKGTDRHLQLNWPVGAGQGLLKREIEGLGETGLPGG